MPARVLRPAGRRKLSWMIISGAGQQKLQRIEVKLSYRMNSTGGNSKVKFIRQGCFPVGNYFRRNGMVASGFSELVPCMAARGLLLFQEICMCIAKLPV